MAAPALSRPTWLSPRVLRVEALSGLVVALSLIPEALAFSVIAGVDPRVGLFSAVTMAIVISVCGGRPAMISGATGAVALVIAPLVASHGVQYLIAAVLLGGVVQILLAVAGVAKVMRFLPRSVMIGFVNALAILLVINQARYLIDVPWQVYVIFAVAVVVLVWLPKLTTAVPAPLVAIVGITVFTVLTGTVVPTVADEGALPDGLPPPVFPDVPLTWDTLQVVAPYAVALAVVGLLESLLTAKLVDEITDTRSNKTREAWGQGVANVVTGVFGGMGGCALIGQTMVNVKIGGARTRLSTFLAGAFLLVLVVVLGDVVGTIPMAALAAVVLVVAVVGTFDWHSVAPATLRRMPRSETLVMVITVVLTLVTDNLAIGVGCGVLAASVLFARRVATVVATDRELSEDGARVVYRISGNLFFASSGDLVTRFSYADDPADVEIDLSAAHIWDASTVAVFDAISLKYEARGVDVVISGMDEESRRRHSMLAGHLAVGK